MTTYRIKLKDLTEELLRQLHEQYLDEDAEVEIRIHGSWKRETRMSEEEFWKIIDLLDWEKEGDDEGVLAPAVQYLSQFSKADMARFQDILSEKLYRLDGQRYAENIGEHSYGGEDYFSADIFLYARCCVVANGRELYEHVLDHPEDMPKDLTFEALLYLADEAHQKKTGHSLDHVPAFNYETFFNAEGWGSTKAKL